MNRAVVAALLGIGALAPAGASAATSTSLLPRFERPARTGRPPSGRTMRIAAALARPDPAGEDHLLAALYDPHSASYHRFLTAQDFARRFGVAPEQVAAAREWLRRAGLDVLSVSRSRDYIVASGTVAQVERLTSATISAYRWRGTSFLANDRRPAVPRGLHVLSVLGLDTLRHFSPARGASAPRDPGQVPDTGTLSPQDLWAIYQHPSDQVGAGVSVGIIGAGATADVIESLHAFDDTFGLPMLPVDVVRTPANGNYSYTGVAGEWNLDVSAVHGMAPGLAKEVLYTSPSYADTDLVGSLSAWVSNPDGPTIMNESYGECEVGPLNPVLTNPALGPLDGNEHPSESAPLQYGLANSSHPAEDMILKQAVMEGRTLFASAGDAGSGCGVVYFLPPVGAGNGLLVQTAPLTEDPSDNPFAVGVGGTVLYKDPTDPPTRSVEYSWTHSGGNPSVFIPAPDYQQGVANLNRPCVLDSAGTPSATGKLCRGVPDVAALSGDVISNGYVSGGGTSLSAPLWAGMWARVQGSAGAGTGGFGFANEALYKLGKDPARRARDFYDITLGTNGFNAALPGWDYVTGWGVPNLAPLLADVKATMPVRPGRAVARVACTDHKRPVSRLSRRAKASRSGVSVRGTARDRGCGAHGRGILARVEVAIARQAGKRCRFVSKSGAFGAARSCSRPRYVQAKGTGKWSLALKAHLPAGRYLMTVRAVDLAGNKERPGKANRRAIRIR
ncbi:MAG: kumamolisin [Solirubrobacteraceae bacterium]|nr:kumamolisin [Solirubrobacteraceae bacterium]